MHDNYSLFICLSISSTYPGQSSVGSVANTFRFPLCWRLWTVVQCLWTTGRHIFFKSYDQQLSDFYQRDQQICV